VRLTDTYLKSVVYLENPIAGAEGEIDPLGTGFLIRHDDIIHIVTAAHVAVELENLSPFGIRLNRKTDGLGKIDYIESGKWFHHPDATVDFAVRPYAIPGWADVSAAVTKHIITQFKRESKDVGVGDLAYIVGIFRPLHGKKRNVPVVHTGHIATMADNEKITTFDWRSRSIRPPLIEIEGHLVEAHTFPASSGSPVFVRRSLKHDHVAQDGSVLWAWKYGSVWLLGLWHGAWITDVSTQLGLAKNSVTLGVGMGITVPAPKIIEALDQAGLLILRKEIKEAEAKSSPVIPQSATRPVGRLREEMARTVLSRRPQPRKKSAKR